MIRFDMQSPRERELFADMIAELQKAGAAFDIDQSRTSHEVTIYLLTEKGGERI